MAKKLIFENNKNFKKEEIFNIICDVNIKKIFIEKENIYNLNFFEDFSNYFDEEEEKKSNFYFIFIIKSHFRK